MGTPAVEPVAVVTGRTDANGEPLDSALITRHLRFSLPYRAMFERRCGPSTLNRLLDALAVLLVRLHLSGFSWGDCSLSNTLFRRDAGAFAAYLVDAETGRAPSHAREGQREYDIEVARVNISGEMLDLEAGGCSTLPSTRWTFAELDLPTATTGCGTSSPGRDHRGGRPAA